VWRPAPGAQGPVPDELYDLVAERPDTAPFTARERIAIDFAERFVTDHESIDDERFERLRGELADDEIVDLCICVARFLAFGRITRVLRLDHECPVGV
jgi:alkylhydroperoxidase family enzyme